MIPLAAFRDLLDGLDTAERAAFVAAVYEARGWTAEREGDEHVLVTPPNASERRRVPTTLDADRLHEQVRYALDEDARTRLCRRFFGRTPTEIAASAGDPGDDDTADPEPDRSPTADRPETETGSSSPREGGRSGVTAREPGTGSEGSPADGNPTGNARADDDGERSAVPRWVVVGLAVVVVGGIVAVAGVGVTDPGGGNPTAPTTPAAGATLGADDRNDSSSPTVGRQPETSGSTPPGVDGDDGIQNASALADAHAAALTDRSYRLRIVHREYVDGELRGVAVERVAVAEPDHYRSRVRTLGTLEHATIHVADVSAYANGTARHVRPIDGRDTPESAEFRLLMVSDTGTPNRYVDRTRRYVQWFLDVGSSRVVATGERGGTDVVTVVIAGEPWRGATEMTGRAVVDEEGLVRVIHREYTPTNDPSVRVESTIRITPGPVTVTRPAWAESTNATTVTPRGAEALDDHGSSDRRERGSA